ncbi:MAG: GNAT family N-acetyltransferase [Hyphomicrobiaceae bacterium]
MAETKPQAARRCTIRPAGADDFAAIAEIYRPSVLGTAITFEVEPPSAETMRNRWRASQAAGTPYLVAEVGGKVVGYAGSRPFGEKAGFAWTLENAIYLDSSHQRHGIGLALLEALVDEAAAKGFRQMVALITALEAETNNEPASVHLHRRAGFVVTGRLASVGFKFDQWYDLIYMQRALGEGAGSPPV